MIASNEVDVWVHPEKGLCPNRLVRCRLDYVNKRLRVYLCLKASGKWGSSWPRRRKGYAYNPIRGRGVPEEQTEGP